MAILSGVELHWNKLLGDPRLNYNEDGKEWAVDLHLTDDHIAAMEKEGFSSDSYLKKVKGSKTEILVTDDGKKVLKYTRPEFNKDGKANKRVTIIDGEGMPWDQETMIGNGSIADLQYSIYTLPPRRGLPERGKLALVKLLIKELVPFEKKDTEELALPEGGTKIREDWSEDESES